MLDCRWDLGGVGSCCVCGDNAGSGCVLTGWCCICLGRSLSTPDLSGGLDPDRTLDPSSVGSDSFGLTRGVSVVLSALSPISNQTHKIFKTAKTQHNYTNQFEISYPVSSCLMPCY